MKSSNNISKQLQRKYIKDKCEGIYDQKHEFILSELYKSFISKSENEKYEKGEEKRIKVTPFFCKHM